MTVPHPSPGTRPGRLIQEAGEWRHRALRAFEEGQKALANDDPDSAYHQACAAVTALEVAAAKRWQAQQLTRKNR